MLLYLTKDLAPVTRFARNLHVVLGLEDPTQAFSNDAVVVCNYN